MTTATTLTQTTGIVTQDRRLGPSALWAAESSYTEQAPRPSITPSASYRMRLEAGGTVEDSTATYELQVVEGGQPGRSTRAARAAWRPTGGTWLGWDLPSSIVGYGAVEVGDATHIYARPSILALPSGVVLLAYSFAETGADTGIGLRRLAAASTTWGSRALVHDTDTDGAASHPVLVQADSSVLLLHWIESPDASCWSIRVHISDDEGGTWRILRRYAISETDITSGGPITRGRIAAAYLGGQLLVVCHLVNSAATYDDVLRQYASGDLGATMVKVGTQTGAAAVTSGSFPAVVAVNGRFLVCYINPDGPARYARIIGGAFQPFSEAAAIYMDYGTWNYSIATLTGAVITDADFAITVDDAGTVWYYARNANTGSATANCCYMGLSSDGGLSWEKVGVSPIFPNDQDDTACWWLPQPTGSDATVYPTNFSATFARGRVLIAHSHYAATATTDASVGVLTLGGYQSVTQPPTRQAVALGDRAHWNRTWIPVERPDDMGGTYTTTTSGTGTASITAAGLLSTSTPAGAGTQFYHEDDATNGSLAFLGEWAVQVTAGGSTTVQEVGITLRLSDGTSHGIEVQLRISQSGYAVYDVVAASTLATVTGTGSGAKAYRIGAYSDGTSRRFQVWHRLHNALDEGRAWTLGYSTSTLGDSFASGTTRVRWGLITASTNTTALWYHLGWSVGDVSTGDQAVGTRDRWDAWSSASSPTGLQGRPISTQHVYLGGGYTVRGTQGPGAFGDTFTLRSLSQYALTNVFSTVSRSPRLGWRSVDDSSAQSIALALHSTILGTGTSAALSPVWALVLQGCNWRTATLQKYTGGAWSTLAAIDLSHDSLPYVRTGGAYEPDGVASSMPYAMRGEWIGATWASSALRRRILDSSEGAWSTSYAGPRLRVAVSGGTAVDAASGVGGRIWSTRGAIVFPAPTCAGLRLVIDAQDTVDNDLRIGSLLLGPCYLAPRRPDWQQEDATEPGHRRQRRDDGSMVVTNQAPPARRYGLAWTDGVDESQAFAGSPDYAAWASGESPGAPSALPRALVGLIRDHDGEQVALLPAVTASASAVTLRRHHEILVGTMTSSAELEAALGEELSTQVQRVAALVVEEDP
jgi:hypothetical protein